MNSINRQAVGFGIVIGFISAAATTVSRALTGSDWPGNIVGGFMAFGLALALPKIFAKIADYPILELIGGAYIGAAIHKLILG